MKKCDLTQEYIKSLLHYNLETGIFIWRVANSNRIKIGGKAGTYRNNGYIRIEINSFPYYAHRLAWLYVTGNWPNEIDHINGIRDDNRFCNLRECNRSSNNRNRTHYGKKNVSKGIYLKRGKFVVLLNLGTFETLKEAEEIRDKILREYHKEYFKL